MDNKYKDDELGFLEKVRFYLTGGCNLGKVKKIVARYKAVARGGEEILDLVETMDPPSTMIAKMGDCGIDFNYNISITPEFKPIHESVKERGRTLANLLKQEGEHEFPDQNGGYSIIFGRKDLASVKYSINCKPEPITLDEYRVWKNSQNKSESSNKNSKDAGEYRG